MILKDAYLQIPSSFLEDNPALAKGFLGLRLKASLGLLCTRSRERRDRESSIRDRREEVPGRSRDVRDSRRSPPISARGDKSRRAPSPLKSRSDRRASPLPRKDAPISRRDPPLPRKDPPLQRRAVSPPQRDGDTRSTRDRSRSKEKRGNGADPQRAERPGLPSRYPASSQKGPQGLQRSFLQPQHKTSILQDTICSK